MADLFISPTGEITGIYDESFSHFYSQGDCEVTRASHVEPKQLKGKVVWEADMSPSGGPLLGPFSLRSEALAAEVEWLTDHLAETQI